MLMDNPIEKLRISKKMSINKFAEKIGSNTMTVTNAETKGVLVPEDLVRKIGLAFDDVDEGKLLHDYKVWQDWKKAKAS